MQQEGRAAAPGDDRGARDLRHPALARGGPATVPRSATPLAVVRPSAIPVPPVGEPMPVTTWRLEPGRRRRVELMAIGLAALGLGVSAISASLVVRDQPDLDEAVLLLAPALLLFVAAVSLARATRRIRLVVTEDGLTNIGIMSTLVAPWSDMGAIVMTGRGIYRGVGVHLTRPGTVRAPTMLRRLGLGTSASYVPLGPYATPFDGSALEADLRRRCPRLFADPHPRQPTAHV